jgi:hypothetical protein
MKTIDLEKILDELNPVFFEDDADSTGTAYERNDVIIALRKGISLHKKMLSEKLLMKLLKKLKLIIILTQSMVVNLK